MSYSIALPMWGIKYRCPSAPKMLLCCYVGASWAVRPNLFSSTCHLADGVSVNAKFWVCTGRRKELFLAGPISSEQQILNGNLDDEQDHYRESKKSKEKHFWMESITLQETEAKQTKLVQVIVSGLIPLRSCQRTILKQTGGGKWSQME